MLGGDFAAHGDSLGEKLGLMSLQELALSPGVPFASSVTSAKLFNHSGLQFLNLKCRDKKTANS